MGRGKGLGGRNEGFTIESDDEGEVWRGQETGAAKTAAS
jgi:hypothetical protein